MPIELKDEEAEIRAIILELRDKWSTIDMSNGLVDGLAEPWTWLPTPQLIQQFKDSKTPEKREPPSANGGKGAPPTKSSKRPGTTTR